MKTNFLLIFYFLLCSCGEDFEKNKQDEITKFNKQASNFQKGLIEKYFLNDIQLSSNIKEVRGGLFFFWDDGNKIYPHHSFNTKFKKEGYCITCNQDSLNFLIVIERKLHKVGTYSNGADANRMETIVTAIDAKTGIGYELFSEIGDEPPQHTKSNIGTSGSLISEDAIHNIIKNIITK